MSAIVDITESILRFESRRGRPPSYVEIGKSEMDAMRAESRSLSLRHRADLFGPFDGFKICGVPIRERPDGITLKKWGEMLRS